VHKLSRRKFLELCSVLGLSMPAQAAWYRAANPVSCNFSGSVLIIGAGAAGMAAGYLLAQNNVDFQILEAAPTYGGRMKRTTDFADFPIPLGAEWLHVAASELQAIVNNPKIPIRIETKGYATDDRIGYFESGTLTLGQLDAFTEVEDLKFINSTWFDFFDEYIVPSIRSKMRFNTQITSIDYLGAKVVLRDKQSTRFKADKLIVTVPLKILQDGDIEFMPALPREKLKAMGQARVWGGIKVFMQFSQRFYPTFLAFPDSQTRTGQRLYYDAAYAQNTDAHILGLFAVGKQAEQYQALSGAAQRDFILAELDSIFEGAASKTYMQHKVQNWNDEPFIRGAYLADNTPSRISRILSRAVENTLFFAGEAYTQEDDWGSVHNAARSARDAVEELLAC